MEEARKMRGSLSLFIRHIIYFLFVIFLSKLASHRSILVQVDIS